MALLSRDLGQASVPCGSGPKLAEAQRRLKLWGSQFKIAEEFEKGMALLRSSVTGSSDLLDQDVLSLESSDPDSMLGYHPARMRGWLKRVRISLVVSPLSLPDPHKRN